MELRINKDYWSFYYKSTFVGNVCDEHAFIIHLYPQNVDDLKKLEQIEIGYHIEDPDKNFEKHLIDKIHEETDFYYTSYSFRWYHENQIWVNIGYPIMTI